MAGTKKRSAIVLEKLATKSADELGAMVKELCSDHAITDGDELRSMRWNRRFAASGKGVCTTAPRIRFS